MSGALWATLRHGFHAAALPLASYYAVTLGVPLANGAARSDGAFVRHLITIVVVPPITIVLACAIRSTVGSLIKLTALGRDERFLSRSAPKGAGGLTKAPGGSHATSGGRSLCVHGGVRRFNPYVSDNLGPTDVCPGELCTTVNCSRTDAFFRRCFEPAIQRHLTGHRNRHRPGCASSRRLW